MRAGALAPVPAPGVTGPAVADVISIVPRDPDEAILVAEKMIAAAQELGLGLNHLSLGDYEAPAYAWIVKLEQRLYREGFRRLIATKATTMRGLAAKARVVASEMRDGRDRFLDELAASLARDAERLGAASVQA